MLPRKYPLEFKVSHCPHTGIYFDPAKNEYVVMVNGVEEEHVRCPNLDSAARFLARIHQC